MKDDNLAVMVKDMVDKETAKFLRDLPTTIRHRLTKASMAILGLDQQWGREHVQISEKGSAFFSSLLTDEVKKQCAKMVPGITKRALKLFTERRLNDLVDRVVDTYSYAMKQAINKRLEELAARHATIIGDKIEERFEVELLKNLDLNDPESFTGKLGEFALEAIAREIVNDGNELLNHVTK